MNGVSIIETDVITSLFKRLDRMETMFKETAEKLEESNAPWMDAEETAEYMKKSVSWVYHNKALLGFSKPGADILFNKKKVDDYLWSVFFQTTLRK